MNNPAIPEGLIYEGVSHTPLKVINIQSVQYKKNNVWSHEYYFPGCKEMYRCRIYKSLS